MSIRLMTAVFDRYPNGGGEMLLALSLADFADDDGTRVFPSIKQLAEKTRQSERTVQYQLRRMEDMGWLILINSGNGGRNQRREYVISPEWIKGADIAPTTKGATDDVKGATTGTKGCKPAQERVQPVAPAYNHHRTINEPSTNTTGAGAPDDTDVSGVCSEKMDCDDFGESYKQTTTKAAIATYCRSEGINATPGNMKLEALVQSGAKMQHFVEAVTIAQERQNMKWGYVLGIVENLLAEEAKPPAPTRPTSRSSGRFDPLAYVNRNRTPQGGFDVIDV